MNRNNNYDVLSKYYNEMVDKNRDYGRIARTLATLIGDRRKLLDIGVGTGLVVEELIQINPEYEIWGIDNSEPLLEQAKSQLKSVNQVHLYREDVIDFNLEQDFEVIYSRGGAILFVDNNREHLFTSHLLGKNDNRKALKCIAKHLQTSGLLILSSGEYGNHTKELGNGVTHHRRAYQQTENEQQYLILDFSFQKNGEIIDRQILKLFQMDYDAAQELFTEVGLEPLNISADGQYHMYIKK